MNELTVTHWILLALGSFIMGMSKGGIPGAGNLTVAIFALVLEDVLGLSVFPCWSFTTSFDFGGHRGHRGFIKTC